MKAAGRPLTAGQAAALVGLACTTCGRDLSHARKLDGELRRDGWRHLFVACDRCGGREGVKYRPRRREPEGAA